MASVLYTIRNIQSWLLGPEVQFTDGPHCGAVIGWLDEQGSPQFLYPEITGYYLSWLSFLAQSTGQADELIRRANLALAWIAKYLLAGETLKTRIYLGPENIPDWRNSGSFSFDLAMLARGVASVKNPEDENLRRSLLEQLFERLLPFCDDTGRLHAFLQHTPNETYTPSRWSCAHGPQQIKAATAILSSNSISQIPARLLHTSNSVYKRWRDYTGIPGPDGTHAAFYHLEGLVLAAVNGLDTQAPALIENGFRRIVAAQEPLKRSDVLAQALRIGCLLCNGLQDSDLTNRLQRFADELEQFTTPDGGMLFSKSPHYRHKNVWSAIFAHQALYFYEVIASGNSLDNHMLQLLI
ncbi:MAG: hypothetical protein JXA73_19595 [Acidobacteria bacterium]|nr:hypothetical protein [Acidobacteriota bacterium]